MTKMEDLRRRFKELQPVWDAFEKLGWRVKDYEYPQNGQYQPTDEIEIELEIWSPAGEDIVEYLYLGDTRNSILEQLYNLANNYDAEEHAEIWIGSRGENGVPDSIRTLLDDAEEIGKMYWELYNTVNAMNI